MNSNKITIIFIVLCALGFGYFMYSTWPNYQSKSEKESQVSTTKWIDTVDFENDTAFDPKPSSPSKNSYIKLVFVNGKGVDTIIEEKSDAILDLLFIDDRINYVYKYKKKDNSDEKEYLKGVMNAFHTENDIKQVKFICDRWDEVIMVVERKNLLPESYSFRMKNTFFSKKHYNRSDDEYNVKFGYRVTETILRKCRSN